MAAEGLESTVFTLECRYILAGLGDILMEKIKQEREILKGRDTPYSKLLNSCAGWSSDALSGDVPVHEELSVKVWCTKTDGPLAYKTV